MYQQHWLFFLPFYEILRKHRHNSREMSTFIAENMLVEELKMIFPIANKTFPCGQLSFQYVLSSFTSSNTCETPIVKIKFTFYDQKQLKNHLVDYQLGFNAFKKHNCTYFWFHLDTAVLQNDQQKLLALLDFVVFHFDELVISELNNLFITRFLKKGSKKEPWLS